MEYSILSMMLATVWATGANIEILTDRNTVECGSKFTLTCKIANSTIVTWMFEDYVIPIAKCLRNSCSLNHNYVAKYQFTYDLDQGVYNLTIINVTKTDIGRKFVCSNGHNSVSKSVSMKEYQVLLFEDTHNEVLTATFGCISPETNVVMKWTKLDAVDSQISEFLPQFLYTSTKTCSNVSVCNTNQQIHHLVAISAKPSENGKYRLRSTVTYENVTIESSITSLKYNVGEKVSNNCNGSDDKKNDKTTHISIFFGIISLLILCNVIICLRKRSRYKFRDEDSCNSRCCERLTKSQNETYMKNQNQQKRDKKAQHSLYATDSGTRNENEYTIEPKFLEMNY